MKRRIIGAILCALCLMLAACQTPQTTTKRTVLKNLVDNEQCVFDIVSVDAEDTDGYNVGIFMENKTDDTLTFTVKEALVNDCAMSTSLTVTVAANSTLTDALTFFKADLSANKITQVNKIEFTLVVSSGSENYVSAVYEFTPGEKAE